MISDMHGVQSESVLSPFAEVDFMWLSAGATCSAAAASSAGGGHRSYTVSDSSQCH